MSERLRERERRGSTARTRGAPDGPDRATPRLDPSLGKPLPPPFADAWEPRLGPLTDVRVHDDHAASELAHSYDARAVVIGRAIAFDRNEYRPHTAAGRGLLAHELVHVAQPQVDAPAAAGPDIAAGAEREAHTYRGPERPSAPRARVQRFPRAEGLRDGERLPAPLLMAVAGDRFLVRTDLSAQRTLSFVIVVQGDLPVEAPGLVDRTFTLPVIDVTRPVATDFLEIYPSDFAIDLYGDGTEIIRLVDRSEPGPLGETREHQWRVLRNGEAARRADQPVQADLRVRLPAPPRNTRLGEAGTGTAERVVSSPYDNYGDAFQLSARRFGATGLIAVHVQSAIWAVGSHPTTLVRLAVPADRLTLTYTRREGTHLEIDLDGDGVADVRFEHTVSEHTVPAGIPRAGYLVRTHRFDAFTARGERVGEVNRHDIYHDPESATSLPAIPAAGRASADESDAGAPLAVDAPPLDAGRPGEASRAEVLPGGAVDLRVDGDGDRLTELQFRFRPRGECSSDGGQRVGIEIVHIETHTVVTTELNLDGEQAQRMVPLVVRPADSANTAVIDVVNRFVGPVASSPVTIEIDPPVTALVTPTIDTYETTYPLRVAGAPLDLVVPYTASTAAPLASDVTTARFADLGILDVTLGEYGDRFRLTLEDGFSGGTLGLSAMNADRPGETRAIALQAGAAEHQPVVVASHAQQLVVRLGELELVLVDAIQAPVDSDVQLERTHRVTVFGSAVEVPRTVRFDQARGSFGYDDVGVEFNTHGLRGRLPTSAEEQYQRMFRHGSELAPVLRAAIDRGRLGDVAYDAFRDAHRAMLQLRWDTAQASVQAHRGRLVAQGDGFLLAMRAAEPAAVDGPLTETLGLYRAQDWDAAFARYVDALAMYVATLRELASHDRDQRRMSIAAASVDVMRGLLAEGSSFASIRIRIEAAAGTEVVNAHAWGLISDDLYGHWDTLRRTVPMLHAIQNEEATYQECSGDPALTTVAREARYLHFDLCTLAREWPEHAQYTGETLDTSAGVYRGGWGPWLADAIVARNWDLVFSNYVELMTSTDRLVAHLIEARRLAATGADRDEWQQRLDNNRYVTRMRSELGELAAIPDVTPVAATFVPNTQYANQNGYIPAVPIRLFVWHDGGGWRLRDLTNPERKYETSADGDVSAGPPHALFADLNDNDRFPKGVLYYQVPDGGRGGRVVCTADKEWFEWVADIGLGLALVGLTLATFGTGTVAVVGGYFLAGAAITNAVAATGRLVDSVSHGHASTTSVTLDVLDVVSSLASAGSLVAGSVVRSAGQAARVGTSWTGAAARVAAFADRAYVPLTAASVAADVTTAAVMTHDVLNQLDRLETSGLTGEQLASARQGLLLQLAITGGLTALSVKGDLPELASGRRNIVLDVVGDLAVARAAGVHLGDVELGIITSDARAHAGTRWHTREAELPPPSGVTPDDAMTWRRAWLEQEHPVSLRSDGGYDVNVPAGAPPEVDRWLRDMAGPDSALVRAERTFSVADDMARLEAASPGLRVDPFDPSWAATTRPQVVSNLGGGPAAEAIVRRFEAARLGMLGSPGEFAAARSRANRVLPDNELERATDLFPGHEVYLSGAPLGDAVPGSRLDRVELVVSVTGDVSPDMMAAMERRGELIRLRPDPEFLRANGLPPDHTVAVEVRVVPRDAMVGLASTDVALHRIDDALATRQVDLDALLTGHLNAMGVSPDALPHPIQVLTEADFAARFSSARGRTVFQLEDGQAVIYARPDATRLDLLDEAQHLAQALDPSFERQIRTLSGANFADWASQPAQFRFEIFETKVAVEIDAKRRTLAALRADVSAVPADLVEVERQLADLQALQAHMAGITPDQLSLMNAGVLPMPSYLESPPWLFGKRTVYGDLGLHAPVRPTDAPRTVVATTGPGRSTAYNDASVDKVHQVGSSWRERTQIYSGFDGEVTAVDVGAEATTVTVRRAGGSEQTYVIEGGGLHSDVTVGSRVTNGQTLGEEVNREYRRVEITDSAGRTTTREEILRLGPDGGWIQRGSESTARGALMETAAARQLDIAVEAARARGEIDQAFRIPHGRGGGGFDDVVVEFTSGPGGGVAARVRVREVKDYPNRWVPLADFTAIRREGGGLNANLEVLRRDVRAAIEARLAGDVVAAPFASMSDDQLRALETAVNGHGIQIEVVVGPTTRIGAERLGDDGSPTTSVMANLRAEITAEMGYDALVTRADALERVDQALVDEAVTARAAGTASP